MGCDCVAVDAVDVGQVVNGTDTRSVVGNELIYVVVGEASIRAAYRTKRPRLTRKQGRELTPFNQSHEGFHRFR